MADAAIVIEGDTVNAISPAPIKDTIDFATLESIDIRVGTIERVDDVEGSKKLVKLSVDFGDHCRTSLAGMKQERDDPREIEGKQALFVVTLEPRKMAGEVSEGMLFDIGYADGVTPVLATPEASRAFPRPQQEGVEICGLGCPTAAGRADGHSANRAQGYAAVRSDMDC